MPAKQDCPYTQLQNWGRDLAQRLCLNPKEVTYDSDMLHFVFDGEQDRDALNQLHIDAIESGYIKAPYVITDFSETTQDLADEEGETVWTMGFWNQQCLMTC
jgi:hypothetical protein